MSNKLKQVRMMKMLSMSELARKSGISRQTIHKLEHGAEQSYTMRTLMKIAHALDTPVTEIFDVDITDIS